MAKRRRAAGIPTAVNPGCPVAGDRKSTRLNSSHTEIYTLSLHDALPICRQARGTNVIVALKHGEATQSGGDSHGGEPRMPRRGRSEEHTSELQSHRDLHSFPTRRSSDLPAGARDERDRSTEAWRSDAERRGFPRR